MISSWSEAKKKLKDEGVKEKLEISESGNFKRSYEKYIGKLEKILEKPINDEEYLWDAVVAKSARKIEKVLSCMENDKIGEYTTPTLRKDIDLFLERCKDKEFHIAIVGAIKAGKSTLINAMIGEDIASTNITPETASLTKFRHSSQGNYIKISFYSDNEWEVLWESVLSSRAEVFLEEYENLQADKEKSEWLNHQVIEMKDVDAETMKEEVKKWSSAKSAAHYFVKEVEVGLAEFDLPEGVILVDTPGLDDVVEYRSNITREYINRANVVLVCVQASTLTATELSTIYAVFSNTRYMSEKVYIVATQRDILNSPLEDWKMQEKEWIKYLKGKSAFGSAELAKKNLISISAYLYSTLINLDNLNEDKQRKKFLKITLLKFDMDDDEFTRDKEEYSKLMKLAGIDRLKIKLKGEVITNFRDLQIRDIQENYDLCKSEILSLMKSVKGQQVEVINLAQQGKDEIKRKRKECEKQLEEEKKEKVILDDLLEVLYQQTEKKAEMLSQAIRSLV